jgi:hypothetical protein
MKRQLIVSIEKCKSCPELLRTDGFASHSYYCPHIKDGYSKEVDDPKSKKIVEKELSVWFMNCPKWKVIE